MDPATSLLPLVLFPLAGVLSFSTIIALVGVLLLFGGGLSLAKAA